MSGKTNAVLQDWLLRLSWKKQTVVMEMFRAPDVPISHEAKAIIRFIRAASLKNADPTTDFMSDVYLPSFKDIYREFERLPLHVAHHILMTLQIIGMEGPDEKTNDAAWKFYDDAVHAQHLNLEARDQYESRYLTVTVSQ